MEIVHVRSYGYGGTTVEQETHRSEVRFSLVVQGVTIGSDAMVRARGYSMFDRKGKVGVRTTALGIVVGRRLYGLRSMCE